MDQLVELVFNCFDLICTTCTFMFGETCLISFDRVYKEDHAAGTLPLQQRRKTHQDRFPPNLPTSQAFSPTLWLGQTKLRRCSGLFPALGSQLQQWADHQLVRILALPSKDSRSKREKAGMKEAVQEATEAREKRKEKTKAGGRGKSEEERQAQGWWTQEAQGQSIKCFKYWWGRTRPK